MFGTGRLQKIDGEEYYEDILVYVDNFLAVSLNAQSIILEVAEKLRLNMDKIEPPEVYLGGRLVNNSFNGKDVWTIPSMYYIKAIIKNIEVRLTKEGMKLPSRAEMPMSSDYKPDLDATSELDTDGITMYQELIGELI